MGATEDIKTILQDVVTPDMKDIKDRLTALENKVDDNTRDLTSLLERKHTEVMQRLAALEAKQPWVLPPLAFGRCTSALKRGMYMPNATWRRRG
jgi:hypothetical protein